MQYQFRSSKEPGAMASTSGTGFAISAVAWSMSDKRPSTVKVDAQRMGKLVTKQVSNVIGTTNWNVQRNVAESNVESLVTADCANEIGPYKGGAISLVCRLSVKIVEVSCFSVDSHSRCATFAVRGGLRKSRID
jgi:hypothetical protein